MNEHPSQDTLSRKEREKLARQQDILKAARELIVANGFRDTTLDEIAQRAEFGKGTLYNYFASKEDIFHALIDQAIEHSIALAREAVNQPGDVRSRLTSYARATMLYIRENGELLHAIFQEIHGGRRSDPSRLQDLVRRGRTVTDIIGTVLTPAMDAGIIHTGDPADYVTLLDDMIRGFAGRQMTLQGALTNDEIDRAAGLIVTVLLDGITVRNSKG
jgi:TetR/AcrR family transcriptional regulator, repressor of fatR-cypB operon